MLAKSSGSPLSPIRIKQEGTFYARLLSKENSSSATPSFRVYHEVVPASVPFVWESQPGTPKATFAATQLPPLTPPPSSPPPQEDYGRQEEPKVVQVIQLPGLLVPKAHSKESMHAASADAQVASVIVTLVPLLSTGILGFPAEAFLLFQSAGR
ncbi:hypothetical protein MUK42_03728 [Musa troglodytarum]|uniref:Uncharacterized protein n=1 Tax=Musa troglodytarum TaxID=320322 RepID=A0A9E7G2J0_9LILI|nr:hypothetical protein MUK42_03728 [Musa troglodytarum]